MSAGDLMNTYARKTFDGLKQSPSLQNETQFHEFHKNHKIMNHSTSHYDTASMYSYRENSDQSQSYRDSTSSITNSSFSINNNSLDSRTSNNFLILNQLNQKQKLKLKLKQDKLGINSMYLSILIHIQWALYDTPTDTRSNEVIFYLGSK